jgi:putative membrane protein
MTTGSSPPALDSGTRLAVDRTRLAHERTMMAWIRTAASLISFGFTIYKFFQLELKSAPVSDRPVLSARGFALIMISTGLMALLLAGVQHRQSMQLMRQMYGPQPRSVAGAVGWFVALLGLFALIGVIARI